MNRRSNVAGRPWLTTLLACALLGITAVASTGFTSAPVAAQDDGSKESMAVVVLQYASCDEMARVLHEMVPEAKVTFDARTNSLLVKATTQYHTVVRDYIARLDRPIDPPQDDRSVEVIQFRNTKLTPGIQRALMEMFDGRTVKMSLDVDRNMLVVEANDETLKRIRTLVEELDTKQSVNDEVKSGDADGSYRVRIVWLVTGAPAEAGQATLPDDLQPVVTELNKLGVTNLKLAAQMLTRVRMNQQFSIHATPTMNQKVQLESSGTLIGQGRSRPELRIEVEARNEMEMFSPQGPVARQPETMAALKTTIDAPIGHFVVLGVTPIGSMTSVFVVQLQRGEQDGEQPGEKRVW